MEPEEYSEYFKDTILSRTPELGQKGCYAKVPVRNTRNTAFINRRLSFATPPISLYGRAGGVQANPGHDQICRGVDVRKTILGRTPRSVSCWLHYTTYLVTA